jgi:hypothetical protein
MAEHTGGMQSSSWFGSLRIMEPGLLQLQNGADHAGRQHGAFDQMISQLGGNRLM